MDGIFGIFNDNRTKEGIVVISNIEKGQNVKKEEMEMQWVRVFEI